MKKQNTRNEIPEHPERQEDEVHLTNTTDDPELCEPGQDDWSGMEWKTKRKGMVAYDTKGKPVPHLFPVFVKQSEVRRVLGAKTLSEMLPTKPKGK